MIKHILLLLIVCSTTGKAMAPSEPLWNHAIDLSTSDRFPRGMRQTEPEEFFTFNNLVYHAGRSQTTAVIDPRSGKIIHQIEAWDGEKQIFMLDQLLYIVNNTVGILWIIDPQNGHRVINGIVLSKNVFYRADKIMKYLVHERRIYLVNREEQKLFIIDTANDHKVDKLHVRGLAHGPVKFNNLIYIAQTASGILRVIDPHKQHQFVHELKISGVQAPIGLGSYLYVPSDEDSLFVLDPSQDHKIIHVISCKKIYSIAEEEGLIFIVRKVEQSADPNNDQSPLREISEILIVNPAKDHEVVATIELEPFRNMPPGRPLRWDNSLFYVFFNYGETDNLVVLDLNKIMKLAKPSS